MCDAIYERALYDRTKPNKMKIKLKRKKTYSSLSVARVSFYLHTVLCLRRARGLFDESAKKFRLKFGNVETLLDGVGSEHHVIVDAGRVHDDGGEQ
jgi:hypothetical protein